MDLYTTREDDITYVSEIIVYEIIVGKKNKGCGFKH